MAVYVDVAIWERHDRRWCHLLADDAGELHAFAARLGIERRRFQSRPGRPWVDHYDVDEQRRQAAVAHGASELTRREVVELIRGKRAVALAGRDGRNGRNGRPYAGTTASPTATAPPSSTAP
jgi:hypothetical protein